MEKAESAAAVAGCATRLRRRKATWTSVPVHVQCKYTAPWSCRVPPGWSGHRLPRFSRAYRRLAVAADLRSKIPTRTQRPQGNEQRRTRRNRTNHLAPAASSRSFWTTTQGTLPGWKRIPAASCWMRTEAQPAATWSFIGRPVGQSTVCHPEASCGPVFTSKPAHYRASGSKPGAETR